MEKWIRVISDDGAACNTEIIDEETGKPLAGEFTSVALRVDAHGSNPIWTAELTACATRLNVRGKLFGCDKCESFDIYTRLRAEGDFLDGQHMHPFYDETKADHELLRHLCRRCGHKWSTEVADASD